MVVWQASGKNPGNFTTANAVDELSKTGLFEKAQPVEKDTVLYNGDILCTRTKGHIVAVVSGRIRVSSATTKSKKKTVTEIAQEVIAGKWGDGIDRKKNLEAAGWRYVDVQEKVNELLK